MEQLALAFIGLIITGILALIKVTIWVSLGWFWVFVPLMLFTGIWFISVSDCSPDW